MSGFKYVIIVPAGAADAPLDDLDGLTPLEAAEMPNLSRLTKAGRVGSVELLSPTGAARASAGFLALLGVDARLQSIGCGSLLARSFGVELRPDDWAMAVSFVTVDPHSGFVIHDRAGGVEASEAKVLLESLSEALSDRLEEDAWGLEFVTGEGDLHLLLDHSSARDYFDVDALAPIDALDQAFVKALPRIPAAARGRSKVVLDFLFTIMQTSAEVFAAHEVNVTRESIGELPVSQVWLHGMGQRADFGSFSERCRGLSACLITTDEVAAGAGLAAGLDRFDLYDVSAFPVAPLDDDEPVLKCIPTHEDLASAAVRAIEADEHGVVFVYVESPRDAAYDGDFVAKIAALESIDRDIIGPVYDALIEHAGAEQLRFIVLPDSASLTAERRLDSLPVPFMIHGAYMESLRHFESLTEAHARESDLYITPGEHFLEYALFSGLPVKW